MSMDTASFRAFVEFFEARIADDEAVAKAAIQHLSRYDPQTQDRIQTGIDNGEWRTDSYCDPNDLKMIEGAGITIYDEGGHTAEQAKHIARHDPARVLGEVAAKRGIVAKVRQGMVNIRIFPGLWESMQLLAVPYDDHPDYREEWRP